jgi:hypothetical protein
MDQGGVRVDWQVDEPVIESAVADGNPVDPDAGTILFPPSAVSRDLVFETVDDVLNRGEFVFVIPATATYSARGPSSYAADSSDSYADGGSSSYTDDPDSTYEDGGDSGYGN